MFEFLEEENILLAHPDMSFPRFGHWCLIVQNKIYALAGYDKDKHTFNSSCEMYELKENKLTYKFKPN